MTHLYYKFNPKKNGKNRHAIRLVGFDAGDGDKARIITDESCEIIIGPVRASVGEEGKEIDTSLIPDGAYLPKFIKDGKVYTSSMLLVEGGKISPVISSRDAVELSFEIWELQNKVLKLSSITEELMRKIGTKETFTLK